MQFGDFDRKYTKFDNAEFVILPVPYDETSTWIKGADKGPAAILEASPNLEFYDIETDSEVFKHGIHTTKFITEKSSPEKLVNKVYEETKNLLNANKVVVTIGGNHTVSIGAAKAYAEKYENLTIVQLDAHSDMRNEYEGSVYNHACVMARIKDYAPVIQVGIRSMDASEKQNIDFRRVFFAHQIIKKNNWQEEVTKFLTKNTYLTIDLDVFDPSVMPSTGTPEPGGLFWYDVIELIKKINSISNIVGFDVVELCPNPYNKSPDFMAAKLIYSILTIVKYGKKDSPKI